MGVDPSQFISPVWRDGIFKDRVAFVTGGAGDICSGQTRALVYLGANACIIGRNPEKTERVAAEIATVRPGAKVIGIGNVDVRNAADRCVAELGGIDFVIAGAAGNFISPIAGLSSNAFKAVMDIDTLGTFNTIKATIDYLVEAAERHPGPSGGAPASDGPASGGFLAVSATFHYTGLPLQAHVSAAKAGVDSLVASVALEYGPRGVSANVIAPGPIEGTEGMSRLSSPEMVEAQARAGGVEVDDLSQLRPGQRGAAPGIPSGRWGTIRDIADATVYLFSAAGDYVNGHVLAVDGAAWRRQGGAVGVGLDSTMQYPQFLLDGKVSANVKSGRKGKFILTRFFRGNIEARGEYSEENTSKETLRMSQ